MKSLIFSLLVAAVAVLGCKKNNVELDPPINIDEAESHMAGSWKVTDIRAIGNAKYGIVTAPVTGYNTGVAEGQYNMDTAGAINLYNYYQKATLKFEIANLFSATNNFDEVDSGQWVIFTEDRMYFHTRLGHTLELIYTQFSNTGTPTLELQTPLDTTFDGVHFKGKIVIDLEKLP
jgi:hypothetical protein